jgi:hypothetical protein
MPKQPHHANSEHIKPDMVITSATGSVPMHMRLNRFSPNTTQNSPKNMWLRRIVRGFGKSCLWVGSVILADMVYQTVLENSGPKNGITNVKDRSCDVIDGIGPVETGEGKLAVRVIKATGLVYVELFTRELPESVAREEVGRITAPAVTVNDLTIKCPQITPGPGIIPPPPIHYVSTPPSLPPLGGFILAS